jgi:hypothetical protein
MAPLLKPEDCCVLFIDPTRSNAERTDQADGYQDALISRHALIQQAAQVLDVPKFFAIHGDEVGEREWIAQPCERARPRIYAVGSAGSIWSGSGLGAALAEEGKACLLLCGFWLERSVTFAALNALADGFDVFVLMDACPSCDPHAKCPAIDRLLQAGVVPLTTMQMVSEWAEGASDEARRMALRNLLAPTSEQ